MLRSRRRSSASLAAEGLPAQYASPAALARPRHPDETKTGADVPHPRRVVTAALGAALVTVLVACSPGADPSPPTAEPSSTGAAPTEAAAGPVKDAPGVQLFQWTWDAISAECTDVLGPAGYGFVLTSPPQEHVLGPQWWTAYQPVSYRLESRLGTREQLADMVRTCREAGVDVIVDAVVNHMTGKDEPGVGWAGTPYQHYDYPGLYSDAEGDFHHCGLTPEDDIQRYTDAVQVQTCELVNLADLATGTERVRARIVAYLEDLLSLGVAGFRIDAAKHLPAADVAAVVSALPPGTRILQEVIGAREEPVQPADYLPSGSVFDFSYGRELAGYVQGGALRHVPDLGTGSEALPSGSAVVFVENHDTERNGSTLSYKDGDDHVLATVLMLAGRYGTPVVYSGYAFRDRDTGPAQDGSGAVVDAGCAADVAPGVDEAEGTWLCQHRWDAVAGMVGWRRTVADAEVTDLWTERRVLAFGRGDRGFLVANGGEAEATVTVATSMRPGTYCDVTTGGLSGSGCGGEEVTVEDDGALTVTVPGSGAVAIHSDARP